MLNCRGGRVRFLFAAMIMVLGLAVAGNTQAAPGMPHFKLPLAVDGSILDSDQLQGQALLVTFFATWCPPCMQEIPTLIELQDKYSDKGFSVVGISVDEGGPKIVARLIKKMNINYPVVMGNAAVDRGFGGIMGIPTSFLINKKGNVVKSYPGYVPHHVLAADIEEQLR